MMKSTTSFIQKSAIHENIIMSNAELPINFIEHNYSSTGPFCILHWHNELELVYVKEGCVAVGCESHTVELHKGEIVFINSNEPHSYYILEAPIVLYCCTISTLLLQGRYVTSYDSQFIHPSAYVTIFQNHISNDPLLVQHFLAMWEEGIRKEKGYEYAIKANLYGIITLMVRNHIHITISNKEFQCKNRNLNNINKIIQYIEEHYHEDLNLDELAEYLGFNRFYFCRLFKEFTGYSPIKYINNYRVHQAISIIRQQPNFTITQIATMVGYNDSNYFARVFKEITGESPSIYSSNIRIPTKKD